MSATLDVDRMPPGVADYPTEQGTFDEALSAPGRARAPYAGLLGMLGHRPLAPLARQVQRTVDRADARIGNQRFAVDPVPRLIGAAEWRLIESGLRQRATALNRFVSDVYGPQRIFDSGVVPRRLLEGSSGYEPMMRGLVDPAVPPAAVAGPDLVRDGGGRLAVLEDNLRMPSGSAYALTARDAVVSALEPSPRPLALGGLIESLAEAIRASAPGGGANPSAAILSDGPGGTTWFEHLQQGRALGIPVITLEDLERRGNRVIARIDRRTRSLDVILRRIDGDRLSTAGGEETPIGELLLPALRAGTVRCLNAFGTGIADDKLTHAYADEIIRFYMGEDPIIRSVPTIDPHEPEAFATALEAGEGIILKPREGFGGSGITILARPGPAERRAAMARVREEPGLVAQKIVRLSTHPTVCGDRLQPRHVDLRPFVISTAGGVWVMPGGLTRFARRAGEVIVNSSRGGGGKDTWVLPGDGPEARPGKPR